MYKSTVVIIRILTGIIFSALPIAVYAIGPINVDNSGLALRGYDKSCFISNKNRSKATQPINYPTKMENSTPVLPKTVTRLKPTQKNTHLLGGFRSYGVRIGKKFDGDPNIWKIVGGTLYLQLDQGTNAICSKDLKKNIAIGGSIVTCNQIDSFGKIVQLDSAFIK